MDSERQPRHGRRLGTGSMESKARRRPGRQTPSVIRQRNAELLDTALDLFLEKGFEGTSIDGIAAQAGMAKRTVYLRYGDKKGLFKASLQRAIEAWIVPVDRLRAAETDDTEETLLKVGQILVANLMSPAGLRLLHFTNEISGRMPEIGAFTNNQGTAPTTAYLADLVRRRVRPHGFEVPDPEQAAVAFLHLVVGGPAIVAAWGVSQSEQEVDTRTRYAVRLFLHGLLHVAVPAVGASAPAAREGTGAIIALEDENRRLKMLLAESMLELSTFKRAGAP